MSDATVARVAAEVRAAIRAYTATSSATMSDATVARVAAEVRAAIRAYTPTTRRQQRRRARRVAIVAEEARRRAAAIVTHGERAILRAEQHAWLEAFGLAGPAPGPARILPMRRPAPAAVDDTGREPEE